MRDYLLIPQENPICDFCSSPAITHRIRCKSFDLPQWGFTSGGDWAACFQCSELVRKEEWDTLVTRSVDSFYLKYGGILPKETMNKFVNDLHEGFRRNRL